MRRLVVIPLLAALVAVPGAAALDRKRSDAVVRLAAKASGLQPRGPVRLVAERPAAFRARRVRELDRAYPRAAQRHDETVYRALGLTAARTGGLRATLLELDGRRALYDPAVRAAFVQRGPGEAADVLPAAVQALADQHVDYGRLMRLPGASEARVAATAAVEGHATLVAGMLAQRRAASHPTDPLRELLRLQRGFATDVGLRFAADLRNLGGRRALLGALRRFPATTEQVFHLDKYLAREPAVSVTLPAQAGGLALASSGRFGELDVRALLAVFSVPRLDHAASGWGGGRTGVYRGTGGEAVAVALDWDTERDARQWAEAVALLVNEAFDADAPGLPEPVACAATTCWQVGGRGLALVTAGVRTAFVAGPDTGTASAVAKDVLALG